MQEKLYFNNSNGDKLSGVLSYDNLGDDSGDSIVVMAHGFGTGKNGRTYTSLEDKFIKSGLATFRFDFYAHGESDGSIEDITVSEAVDDVFRAVDFVEDKGYSKIGLIGSSFGGLASIIAAPNIDLFALGLKCPISKRLDLLLKDIYEFKEQDSSITFNISGQPLTLSNSFVEDCKKNIGFDYAEKINAPTLIVHGSDDECVSINDTKKLYDSIADCELDEIIGCDHSFSNSENFNYAINSIFNFVIDKT
ncbi:hypothetical protein CMO90_00420 [Candidatus Woesearchaeota archaeon]|jgi:hypothetical protein|nr:hypothetical protein [Candidatus Woesearchaeota archaeon]|tara:strand:+ start:213 stop:962 length:750 start_codon:yes stop_codon:yes gene_type:complete